MVKTCVVNFARGGWYPEGQKRLKESFLSKGYTGDFLFSTDEVELGCPRHTSVPYAFKPYLLKKAVKYGYERVIWCDSAIYLVGDLQRVYDELDKNGYMLVRNGWNTGTWCSDAALQTLGITRAESFDLPHLMANVMGFDFRNPTCVEFLNQYYNYANDGISFVGAWKNDKRQVSTDPRVLGHRHDQTVASVVAWKLGMREWLHNWVNYDPHDPDPRYVFHTYPVVK